MTEASDTAGALLRAAVRWRHPFGIMRAKPSVAADFPGRWSPLLPRLASLPYAHDRSAGRVLSTGTRVAARASKFGSRGHTCDPYRGGGCSHDLHGGWGFVGRSKQATATRARSVLTINGNGYLSSAYARPGRAGLGRRAPHRHQGRRLRRPVRAGDGPLKRKAIGKSAMVARPYVKGTWTTRNSRCTGTPSGWTNSRPGGREGVTPCDVFCSE